MDSECSPRLHGPASRQQRTEKKLGAKGASIREKWNRGEKFDSFVKSPHANRTSFQLVAQQKYPGGTLSLSLEQESGSAERNAEKRDVAIHLDAGLK